MFLFGPRYHGADKALGTGLPAQAPHVSAPEAQRHGAEGGHSPINTGLPLAPHSCLLMQTSQFFRKPTPRRLWEFSRGCFPCPRFRPTAMGLLPCGCTWRSAPTEVQPLPVHSSHTVLGPRRPVAAHRLSLKWEGRRPPALREPQLRTLQQLLESHSIRELDETTL